MSIASKSLEASQYRIRNAAENMANAKSANYVPKSLEFQMKLDRKNDVDVVQLQKVKTHPELTQQTYDPSHSQAASLQTYGSLGQVKSQPLKSSTGGSFLDMMKYPYRALFIILALMKPPLWGQIKEKYLPLNCFKPQHLRILLYKNSKPIGIK